jgi:hypothetical protein
MRHFFSQAQLLAVPALPSGVSPLTLPARLVQTSRRSNAFPPRGRRARRRAVPTPPITRAAEQKLRRASRASPRPQPPHATAVAAAVDFAGRPCKARSTGGSILLRSAHFGSPEPITSGCCLLGALPPLSLRQHRPHQQKPTRLYRTEGDTPSGSPKTIPSTKLPGQIPRFPALAMIESPRFPMVVSTRTVRCGRLRDSRERPPLRRGSSWLCG